ncbi:hypothetical protein XFEB_01593 [Xylella fastidiosa EB92.1]|jgi:hypothetical protein|nr:hypothetical protein XFEB_01593 [Xylella fastidiosa EB92.1]
MSRLAGSGSIPSDALQMPGATSAMRITPCCFSLSSSLFKSQKPTDMPVHMDNIFDPLNAMDCENDSTKQTPMNQPCCWHEMDTLFSNHDVLLCS